MAETYTHTHTHTHTHRCLCKIIIPIIAGLAIINPSYSDIAKNAQSATCDSSTIGTTTGPANLQAAWTANTINLDFYSNDTKVGTGTCSYDGAITLPATPTVPTGYTFGGWRVRQIVQQCSLANVDTSLAGIDYGHKQIQYVANVSPEQNVAKYGLTQPGQWAAEFDYGIIHGIAKCSAKQGDSNKTAYNNDSSNWTATESELPSVSGDTAYCWCKIDSYTKDGSTCNFSSSKFLYLTSNSTYACNSTCAKWCGQYVSKSGTKFNGLRTALYSITQ